MVCKLSKIAVAVGFSLLLTNALYATQEDTPLTATVTVNPIFKISIKKAVLDFGSVDPGSSSPERRTRITCTTNNNRPWAVSLYAPSPLSYDVYEIPNSNFKWETRVLHGTGQATPSGEMSTTPVNFYTAGMGDYITEKPVRLLLIFQVYVPPGQVAGRYNTVVVITMYEE